MNDFKTEKSNDGTTKIIFDSGYHCVLIPQKNNKTALCISSQVGCAMGCEFCYTAKMGFMRNLTKEEIVNQFEVALKHLSKDAKIKTRNNPSGQNRNSHEFITSIVFMGMGEPMNNYPNVESAIDYLHEFYEFPYRKITVSTSGIVPAMRKFIERDWKVHLALSFHSPFQDIRNKLMPYLSRWSIEELVEVCNLYSSKRRDKIMVEYIMIEGLTNRDQDLQKLLDLGFVKMTNFNLIPLNGEMELGSEKYLAASKGSLEKFYYTLRENGFKCFTRATMGDDIDAACGMLNEPDENLN